MCIQYIMHWDKTQIRQIHFDKINGTKIPSFFFPELQLITVVLLICQPYTIRSTRFVSITVFGIFHFNSFPFFMKLIFLINKMHGLDSLTLKRHIPSKMKIIEKPHTVLLQDLWFLSCNKKLYNSMMSLWVGTP